MHGIACSSPPPLAMIAEDAHIDALIDAHIDAYMWSPNVNRPLACTAGSCLLFGVLSLLLCLHRAEHPRRVHA